MSIAQRLRHLDERVLGPPRPTPYAWWLRGAGGLSGFAVWGSLGLAESRSQGSSVNGRVAALILVACGALALALTWYGLRRPTPRGQGNVATAVFWVLMGAAPLLVEPAARRWPLVPLYVGMVAGGVVLAWWAIRRGRGSVQRT